MARARSGANGTPRRTAAKCLIGLILALQPAAAAASSCVKPVVQKIAFQEDAACWTYSGNATHFEGRFRAGQKVSISMSGQFFEYDAVMKTIATQWSARTPSAAGPDDFYADGDTAAVSDILEFMVPQTGVYRFAFAPCMMWHNPGRVRVCTS